MENNEVDALIVRNIADLEAALERIEDSIDPKLFKEAWETLKGALGEKEWFFADDENPDEAWFAPRSWILTDEDGDEDADPWFKLIPAGGKKFRSWATHFVSANSEQEKFSIRWRWYNFYKRDYDAVAVEQADSIDVIVQSGFCQDGRELYAPITFDRGAVAQGLAEDHLREALMPITIAAETLRSAMPGFEKLRAALLAREK